MINYIKINFRETIINQFKTIYMKKTGILLLLGICMVYGLNAQNLQTENVILITLDGMRWQEVFTGADSALTRDKQYVSDTIDLLNKYWNEDYITRRELLMPFLWSTIATKGQIYGNRNYDNRINVSNAMWFSYPGYNEILTGKADNERINSNDKFNNPNVTVLEYINNQENFKGKVAAFGSWDVFPYIINEERSGIHVNAGFEPAVSTNLSEMEKTLNILQEVVPSPWSTVRLDAFTHYYAFEYLKKNHPRLLYIAYGETDDFAHDREYDSYLNSANRADRFIEEIWNWVQSQPQYKDKTSIIISTDHGRGLDEKWTDHNSVTPFSDQTWFAVIGPDFPAKGEIKESGQHYNNQYAATIAYLLGYNFKAEHEAGEVLTNIFK